MCRRFECSNLRFSFPLPTALATILRRSLGLTHISLDFFVINDEICQLINKCSKLVCLWLYPMSIWDVTLDGFLTIATGCRRSVKKLLCPACYVISIAFVIPYFCTSLSTPGLTKRVVFSAHLVNYQKYDTLILACLRFANNQSRVSGISTNTEIIATLGQPEIGNRE